MKQDFKNARLALIALAILCFTACKVDTLAEAEQQEQMVSLVQATGGEFILKTDNMVIDKPNLMLRRAFGVALSGLKDNEGFTADVQLDFNDVPEGYEKLTAEECFLTETINGTESANRINIPAGTNRGAFYLNITKAAIDAHEGKNVAVKLKLNSTSRYTLNTEMESAYILMNTTEFGTLKTDITPGYLKNVIFTRQAGTTARFANLADWTANDAITTSRPTGAGYDDNAGFMGIERWESGDSPIINGKIYQTFTLPAGNYTVDVEMKKVAADKDSYFIVAEGTDLPDASSITSSIAREEITNAYNNKPLLLNFRFAESKEVTMGFLINIDQGVEKIIQASGIKLYKIEGLFD